MSLKGKQIAFSLSLSLLIVSIFSFSPKKDRNEFSIEWSDHIEGDFSFINNWEYPEGVYLNRHGQLSCDGICPIEIDRMMDEESKIYEDSLTAFYELIDTSHLQHTIMSTNRMYEYSGTNLISFSQKSDKRILGQTACNVSTHSSLLIEINKNKYSAWVQFISIKNIERQEFPLKSGTLKIDRELFKKDTVKAQFEFEFINTLEPEQDLFWKGLIYCPIK